MTELKTDRGGRREYPQEFQDEAVKLAESVGINAAADRLGVPRATVGNWTRKRRRRETASGLAPAAALVRAGGSIAPARPAPGELEADNARLRRELAGLRQDNEILRKAAAYFARQSL